MIRRKQAKITVRKQKTEGWWVYQGRDKTKVKRQVEVGDAVRKRVLRRAGGSSCPD